MNTLRKNLFVALAALGFAGAAMAQSAAPAATPTGVHSPQARHPRAMSDEQRAAFEAKRAERQAKRAERQAERAAKLRTELKLTPQQEPAFAAFLAAGKPAGRLEAHKAGEHGQFAALPAPQRMERMIARQKERTARMEARLAAMNKLYAVLTPEQKQVFDSRALRFGGKQRGHGRHGQHGQHGDQGATAQG